jgi:hypothetical protein
MNLGRLFKEGICIEAKLQANGKKATIGFAICPLSERKAADHERKEEYILPLKGFPLILNTKQTMVYLNSTGSN